MSDTRDARAIAAIDCPRCGAKHILTRESLEAKIENSDQSR